MTITLEQKMDNDDAAIVRQEQLESMFPLSDFENQAWQNFYDPGYCALDEIVADHYEAAAFALCTYSELSRGYNTSSPMQKAKYWQAISGAIESWIEDETFRLQQERWEMGL